MDSLIYPLNFHNILCLSKVSIKIIVVRFSVGIEDVKDLIEDVERVIG